MSTEPKPPAAEGGAKAGKKRPLPQTVDEKIGEALRLKLEGNEAFKAGDLPAAKKAYLQIPLYLNGLVTSDSPMRSFFSTIGADANYASADAGSEDCTRRVKELRTDAAGNLSLVFGRMGRWEKALKYADEALGLAPGSSKFLFRRAAALGELGRPDEALACLEEAERIEPGSKAVARALREMRGRAREGEREKRKKEKELFKGAF
ncbi:hypothetical protein TeGR_g13822 [Tetraparma gracilis]|uniref:peptidylprolyl isomerase n=1 Tax=Tetraparma gracilis TaxID=2962635 RepID=A0ABQ6N9J8_9STRA|nr:hypothetical protein TeGR_g13822 [Tetraparma gracilis]